MKFTTLTTLANCATAALLLPHFANAHVSNKNLKLKIFGETVETTKFSKYHGNTNYGDNAVEVDTEGTSAYLKGQIAAAYSLPKKVEITESSYVTFKVDVESMGNVMAICFDENIKFDHKFERCLAFGGNANIANSPHFYQLEKTPAGQSKTYAVPMGNLFKGDINYVVLYLTNQQNKVGGSYTISDIILTTEQDISSVSNIGSTSLVYMNNGTALTADFYQSNYGNQDTLENHVTFSADGKEAYMTGNAWKVIEIPEPHTTTGTTQVTFSAELLQGAEVNAICFDEDKTFGNQRPRCFAFGGNQNLKNDKNFKLLDYNTVGGGKKDYVVEIGQYMKGTEIKYIALLQDNDKNKYAGKSVITDISINEGDAFKINLYGISTDVEILQYGGSQDHGGRTVDINDGGNSITFEGNTWRAFPLEYTIEPNTALQFTVEITELSEVVALCLEENLKYNQKDYQCLAVSGTQDVFNDKNFQMLSPQLTEGESHTYILRPADYTLQGSYNYLTLMNDKDSNRDDGIVTVSDVKIIDPAPSCLATKSWSFTFTECTSTNLIASLKTTFDSGCQNSENSFEIDIFQFFDGDISGGIGKLCDSAYLSISFEDITLEEEQFITEYFDGGTKWNYEVDNKGEDLNVSASRVKYAYENLAEKYQISFPDSHQFNNCELRSAMCCFVADRQANDNNGNCADNDCDDADPADNTDLCLVNMAKSKRSAHVQDGYSIYKDDTEGDVHCHGLAWGNNNGAEDTFKGNNLFYVSMYDHLYTRGYVEEIQGAPMCGCIEQMPVVSRADCTQVDVTQSVTISYNKDTELLTASSTITDFEFNACQGADNNNNDLAAYYQQLVNDGKATTAEKDEFDKHIVGEGNCNNVIASFLNTKGLKNA